MNTDTGVRSGQRLRRRRRVLLVIVVLALVGSVGGVLISTRIKSPAQLAAQTKPPGPTLLTAPVRREVITTTVLAQGAIDQPPQMSGPAAAPGGGGQGNAQPIVTKIFLRPGRAVRPGSVILEVAGQPLFALAGNVPAYRDLVPGESGSDVQELQANLEWLGFSVGSDSKGVFGWGTEHAVAEFYHSIGYTAPTEVTGPKGHKKPIVPLSQFIFVPKFPARIAKIGTAVGKTASGSLVTLSMGNPGITAQLNPVDAPLVRPGMAVTITNPRTGRALRGSVRSVGRRTQTAHSISGGLYVPLRVAISRRIPAAMVGQNVTLTITAAHSAAPVLTVPEAAVFASANGGIYVTKITQANGQVQVPVRVVMTGDGMVGIVLARSGTLAPGDLVVTGENYARLGGAGGKGQVPPGGTVFNG
jgi:peptidoglycan hydrolase-like protein with peptidoglycan-binding domain